jgi:anaerobic nitric oxide reductase flavorubredoxin
MEHSQVTDRIFRITASAGSDLLFEGMWPLPYGVTMNSFVVRGEKTALIDGVCGWDGVPETLHRQMAAMGIDMNDVKYLILNHLEPDHTGWLSTLRTMNPEMEVIATSRGLEMLSHFYGEVPNTRAVKTGDRIDLGEGLALKFIEIPNVHWPETMMTFEESTGTLFPCDLYGSFGSSSTPPYDDTLSSEDISRYEDETFRYYASILAKFTSSVKRALEAADSLEPKIIAPAHGIVWRHNPRRIAELYRRCTTYASGPAESAVTIIWGSMYGMTEKGVQKLAEGIRSEGVQVMPHRVPETDTSFILASLLRSTGVVVAAPTYEYGLFPPAAHAVDEAGRKGLTGRSALRIGSFGWSGGAGTELDEIIARRNLKWHFIDPVEFRGSPNDEDFINLYEAGRALALAVKARL